MKKIYSLDGIRAIAVFIVIVAHSGYNHVVPGGFGVTVFFFLSGFLICTLLLREIELRDSISLKKFYIRRALRILPPYFLVFIAMGIVQVAIEGRVPLVGALMQALMMTNYQVLFGGEQSIVFGTLLFWSLSVEEHFYLLFPILLVFFTRKALSIRQMIFVLLVFCLVALLWRCYVFYTFANSASWTYLATDSRYDSILFGCIFAMLFRGKIGTKQQAVGWQLATLLVLSAFVLLFTFLYRDEFFRQTWRYTIQGLSLMPFFYLAVRYPHNPLCAWLNWSWVERIGLYSYSMYLTHVPIIHLVRWFIGAEIKSYFVVGITFTVAMALGYFINILIERPAVKLRSRYSMV